MSEKQSSASAESRFLDTIARLLTAKWSKWIVLAIWIVVLGIVSPIGSKLTDVVVNDTATFLPEGAESLQVADAQDEFPGGDTTQAVIVYHRDGGLTADDSKTVEQNQQTITDRIPDAQVSKPIPSEDGEATFYTVTLIGSDTATIDNVKDIRSILDSEPEGLEVKVTGPAGFEADFADIFEGIDTKLLLATAAVVTILLLITYRSPFLWILPLLTVGAALQVANASAYEMVKVGNVTVNGQIQGILSVLVFGAGTDYALLMIARYREELRRHERTNDAMRAAFRSASPALLASAGTVVVSLLCLLFAQLNTNQSLGPVGAAGILAALVAMLTLLPALLLIVGRRVFWPFIPQYGMETNVEDSVWGRVGEWVERRPRPIWIGTAIVLLVLASGVIGMDTILSQEEQFRTTPDSLAGQEIIAESYPAGAGQPATVLSNTEQADATQKAIEGTEGIAAVAPGGVSTDGNTTRFFVTFAAEPASKAAFQTVDNLRESVHAVSGADAKVGGSDAQSLDVQNAVIRDSKLVIPLIFVVVFVILGLLLRAIAAPVMLIITNILSNLAALGLSVFLFDRVLKFGGIDPQVIFLGFVFLVALGIDYNIFLMSRVHEEAKTLGTRDGMLKALSVTGGVITSAGVVLAATFAVLGVLPLTVLTELGILIALGVLIDTVIVRSILVPALTFDFGDVIWWPSQLWKSRQEQKRSSPASQRAIDAGS